MSEPAVWYLYCVAGGVAPPALAAGLEAVTYRDLHAVVRPVDAGAFSGLEPGPDGRIPAALTALLREHDQVVREVFARQPVLPMRFGTGLPDRGAALGLLRDRHDELQAQLKRVADHEEWGVKWRCPSPAAEAPEPAEPGRGIGRGYLQKRSRELQAGREAERRFHAQVSRLHGCLAELAAEFLEAEQGCTYLVRQDRTQNFCALAEESGAELSGPWPPYSFCTSLPKET